MPSRAINPTAEEALQAIVPGLAEDILVALRFFYYVKSRPLVPDPMYDQIEKEYMARPTTDEFTTPLNLPGSDKPDDYSDRVKALALYLGLNDHAKLKAMTTQKA